MAVHSQLWDYQNILEREHQSGLAEVPRCRNGVKQMPPPRVTPPLMWSLTLQRRAVCSSPCQHKLSETMFHFHSFIRRNWLGPVPPFLYPMAAKVSRFRDLNQHRVHTYAFP